MIFDNQKTKGNAYLGNLSVKKDGVNIDFTAEQVTEYVKCMQDPIYFICNYVKVISLDKGLVKFTLRGYQDKYIKHITDNKYTICLSSRQSGKCGHTNTIVTIRNKTTGLIEKITVGDLYERTKTNLSKDINRNETKC